MHTHTNTHTHTHTHTHTNTPEYTDPYVTHMSQKHASLHKHCHACSGNIKKIWRHKKVYLKLQKNTLSLSLTLSLSHTHTHTHTHTYTHTRTRTHTHTDTDRQTSKHTQTHMHWYSHLHSKRHRQDAKSLHLKINTNGGFVVPVKHIMAKPSQKAKVYKRQNLKTCRETHSHAHRCIRDECYMPWYGVCMSSVLNFTWMCLCAYMCVWMFVCVCVCVCAHVRTWLLVQCGLLQDNKG